MTEIKALQSIFQFL